jgi:lipoyl synthase
MEATPCSTQSTGSEETNQKGTTGPLAEGQLLADLPRGGTLVNNPEGQIKKPNWLRVKLPIGENYKHVRGLVDTHKLHTICESGNCPNMGECWGEGTATFMILGNVCTRSCGFCAVATGRPDPVDWDEPQRVAEAIYLMKVKHAVITSVDRDELKDGGSIIWQNTIRAVKALNPTTTLETLVPDFKAEKENIARVIAAAPEVVSHNIETVERLTRQVRIQAKYWRSMETLKLLKEGGMRTKSGVMLGLGERMEEVVQTMKDLRSSGVDVITLGQYLQPTKKHLPVVRFVHPDEFAELRETGYQLGFDYVESGPLVRSSYHSERHVIPGYGRAEWLRQKEMTA